VRAGSVIPLGPAMQYTGQKPVDPLSVHVYGFAPLDLAGERRIGASSLYEDDGLSLGYRDGDYAEVDIEVRTTAAKIAISARKSGRYALPYRQLDVLLPAADRRTLALRGNDVELVDSR